VPTLEAPGNDLARPIIHNDRARKELGWRPRALRFATVTVEHVGTPSSGATPTLPSQGPRLSDCSRSRSTHIARERCGGAPQYFDAWLARHGGGPPHPPDLLDCLIAMVASESIGKPPKGRSDEHIVGFVAEQTVSSSAAGIINATTPLWTVLLALAVRHQNSVTSWQAAGLIVGFGGALLIFSPWGLASAVTSAGGLECPAASVSYAISYIYMDRYVVRRGLNPITLSACQLLAAAIMLAVALAIVGARAPHPSAVSVAAVAILGIIGTGIAYVLNYQIITSEGATIASTVTYLLPVVAIVLGVLVLGENITQWSSRA
jgi:hypothetical protein